MNSASFFFILKILWYLGIYATSVTATYFLLRSNVVKLTTAARTENLVKSSIYGLTGPIIVIGLLARKLWDKLADWGEDHTEVKW